MAASVSFGEPYKFAINIISEYIKSGLRRNQTGGSQFRVCLCRQIHCALIRTYFFFSIVE